MLRITSLTVLIVLATNTKMNFICTPPLPLQSTLCVTFDTVPLCFEQARLSR